MDEKIAVLTDTNSGITPEQAARYGIYLVAMPVIIDDETYFENESIFQEEFFQRLRQGARVSTSQPAPGSRRQRERKNDDEGKRVLRT